MQNPLQDVMELDRLSPRKSDSNNTEDSDNDSLEPPFEIHGILIEEKNDDQTPGEKDDSNGKIAVQHPPPETSSLGSKGKAGNPHPVFSPPVINITPSEQLNQEFIDNDQQPIPESISTTPQTVFQQTMDIHDYQSSSSSDDDEAPHSIQFEQQKQQENSPERQPLIPQTSNSSSTGRGLPYDLSRFNSLRLGGNGNIGRKRYMGLEEDPRSVHFRSEHNRSEVIMRWKDVYNMDDFLDRLYQYYEGKGFLCIMLSSLLNLLTVAFVVGFSVFLSECIDYSKIRTSNTLQDVLISACPAKMSWITTFLCIIIGSWWSYMFVRTILYDIPRLVEIKNFVNDILNISEHDLQTLLWRDFTDKIVLSYTESRLNTNGRKLDAYIIANRIMRKDNYIIALFNKNILDLSLPYLGEGQWLTRMMQDYIIYYGILGYVFDEKGRFKKRFKKESNRIKLAIGLRKRFRKMAMLSICLSPVLFLYLVVQSFFKISEEYRQNPALLTARTYSPIATWKLREFNELSHLFNKRITRSHENATKYMLQFPNHLVVIIARFISFISGSLAAILVIITLFDEKFQKGFEITPNRSALFYIGIFGSILAVTQGFTQENIVHEPQRWMNEVVLDTHYLPDDWRDQAHLPSVRNSFAELFDHKIVLLMYELLSIFLVPLFLYTRLTDNTLAIVDFFRDYTVHVDSIGHICSFALFDFDRHGDAKFGSRLNPNHDKLISKNGKMEQSFVNFKSNNPDWDPGLKGSQFLAKVVSKRPYPLGNNLSSRIMAFSQSELGANSALQGDSLMMSNLQEGEADVVRELIKMLDAIYAGNQRV